MDTVALLATLNVTLPSLLAFYKTLRDANPDQPALTDAIMIDLFASDSAAIVAKAESFLATHPKTP